MKITLLQLEELIKNGHQVKINTPTGYEKITNTYRKNSPGRTLTFDDKSTITCSNEHLMWNTKWCEASSFQEGDIINGKIITNIQTLPEQDWIDFSINCSHESYFHNNILHHNSGKSAAIYTLIRYFLTKKLRILLVTPRASLVEQMYTDFQDYSSHNDWNTEEHCHRLYSGRPKFFTKPVTITTWQSIYKHPPQWFSQQNWDVIIVDECHTAVAASLTGILEKLPNTPYRIGLSGTTANTKTARLVLEGLFGSIYTAITTKQLMDRDQIVDLKIKSLILKHPNEDCQVFHTIDYHTEMSFLIKNHQRNKFIVNLAKVTKGNTLILSNYVTDHCDVLIDMLEQNTTKPVYRITGEVKVVTREGIRTKLEKETDTILVGTYGAISMGVNIPSIQNIIFASPTKSMIRTLQSIGRGLRLNNDKTYCNVFDITDDLSWKTKKTLKRNHTLRHGIERFRIYMNEQFNVKIINVNLGQYQS